MQYNEKEWEDKLILQGFCFKANKVNIQLIQDQISIVTYPVTDIDKVNTITIVKSSYISVRMLIYVRIIM